MRNIEKEAVKILFEDNSRSDELTNEQHIFNDIFNFGQAFIHVDKDGNETRIHPMDIIISENNKIG